MTGRIGSAVVAMLLATSCGGECQSTCRDAVNLELDLPIPIASVTGDTIVVCRNGTCSPPTLLANNATVASGGFCASLAVDDLVTSTTLRISFAIGGTGCPTLELNDGDTYRLAITDASSQIVYDQTSTADYHALHICGVDCQQLFLQLSPTAAAPP